MDRFKSRQDLDAHLRNQSFLQQWNPLFWHGRLYNTVRWNVGDTNTSSSTSSSRTTGSTDNDNLDWLNKPKVTWKSTEVPRADHGNTPGWLTASEFQDHDSIMEAKVSLLAALLRSSRRTIVYSGAGISNSAGIAQAAKGSTSTSSNKGYNRKKGFIATPTFTHFALASLAKEGYIHGWIQQNHDGLPQKAGFPQEQINEIHGSWFDPSNPVVKYAGSLKKEEYKRFKEEASGDEAADLVLVLGTSLGGLSADQVATNAAERSLDVNETTGNGTLGMVMINLQQTIHDGKSTLRLFGKTDEVMNLLLQKFENVSIPKEIKLQIYDGPHCIVVPYDADGRRSNSVEMKLDLSPNAQIRLTEGHNIQGAMQPLFMHIGASNGCHTGCGKVVKWEKESASIILQVEGVEMRLGQWWMDAAQLGGPRVLPLVNVLPQIIPKTSNKCSLNDCID